MGKGNKEGTAKLFRWTKLMEHLFLEILAEEAQKGNKPSNTFEAVSINRVVAAISKKFQVQYLDDSNQDSVPVDSDNEEVEVKTNVSSSDTSKRKRKNVQESVIDEQIKFVAGQLGKIANALE
ncbi:hypothetical protein PVK06_008499 [Gossypium arboreum]|uniref:Myb/SANT-like domain-containing protein n=1 Tax=Gossypium arboreum TaxID=29729 RepID=A0ABR0QL11_GOSAR|nr:hypothetical protein PVK06_008499 [Gossypium arboreum]